MNNTQKQYERMINGDEAKETIGRLSRFLDADKILKMKGNDQEQAYFAYRARLDNVIGETNYDYISGQLDIKNIQGKDVIICSGTLIIKDDMGLAVKTVKAYGGTQVLSSGTVGNDIEHAMRSAFINCFKVLSTATERQVEDIDRVCNSSIEDTTFHEVGKNENIPFDETQNVGKTSNNGHYGNVPAGFGKVFVGPEKEKGVTSDGRTKRIYHVKLLQSLTSLGSTGYKSKVYVQELGKEMPFRIFREGIESLEAGGTNASVFLSALSVGMEFSFLGFLNDYKGTEQLVMEAVAE